jgi:hypothetical protein
MYRHLKSVRRVLFVVVLCALAVLVEPYKYFSLLYSITVFHVVFKLTRRALPHVTRA